jgi:hypothetical protein
MYKLGYQTETGAEGKVIRTKRDKIGVLELLGNNLYQMNGKTRAPYCLLNLTLRNTMDVNESLCDSRDPSTQCR